VDAALKDAALDCELDWSRGVGPQRGIYRLDQMRSFFADFADTFESIRIEVDEFIDAGEHVVTPQTGYVRGRDGIEATARITLLWTIRDAAIVRLCLYQERQEALEAVGLRE
jgi:ketosteroid isomerase-like protein